MNSPLLINEPPLMVLPSLAVAVGVNEAIILQQIHYWCSDKRSKTVHQGHVWTYNTAVEWKEQFPFWSVDTIRRAIKNLREKGVLVALKLADNKYDHTLYYRIEYSKLPTPIYAKCLNQEIGKMPKSLSENTVDSLLEEPLQSEVEVPKSTVTSPVTNKPTVQDKPTVRESPKVQRTARITHATIPELKPYYAAYRLGLNGTPCTEPITDSQVKRYAKALQEMLDANYSLESITNTTAKIQKSWNSNSQGKTYTVSPESVLEHWDKYFVPAKTPTNPHSAPPLPTPAITEIDDTPYTEEQHLALRKSMWDAMWVERKHAASNGYFPDYQERIAYDASTDAQKAQSRAQGYVDGFCPVFDEYLAEI